jgi:hypothetical protein
MNVLNTMPMNDTNKTNIAAGSDHNRYPGTSFTHPSKRSQNLNRLVFKIK